MNRAQAHTYAANVRARRVIPCQCAECQKAEMLPAVLRIIAAEVQNKKLRRVK